jgi:hypothetical protein
MPRAGVGTRSSRLGNDSGPAPPIAEGVEPRWGGCRRSEHTDAILEKLGYTREQIRSCEPPQWFEAAGVSE